MPWLAHSVTGTLGTGTGMCGYKRRCIHEESTLSKKMEGKKGNEGKEGKEGQEGQRDKEGKEIMECRTFSLVKRPFSSPCGYTVQAECQTGYFDIVAGCTGNCVRKVFNWKAFRKLVGEESTEAGLPLLEPMHAERKGRTLRPAALPAMGSLCRASGRSCKVHQRPAPHHSFSAPPEAPGCTSLWPQPARLVGNPDNRRW